MKNTPTVVEWLVSELPHLEAELLKKIIEQAKEMEENQQAYIDGYYNRLNLTQLEINSLKTK
jgi:hypothetical protein